MLAVVLVMATAQTAAATNYGTAKPIKKKVGKRTSYGVASLAKGRTYYFQIRAVRGQTAGNKSNRTRKPTIVAQGATTGGPVRIVTHNICSPNLAARHPGIGLLAARTLPH